MVQANQMSGGVQIRKNNISDTGQTNYLKQEDQNMKNSLNYTSHSVNLPQKKQISIQQNNVNMQKMTNSSYNQTQTSNYFTEHTTNQTSQMKQDSSKGNHKKSQSQLANSLKLTMNNSTSMQNQSQIHQEMLA